MLLALLCCYLCICVSKQAGERNYLDTVGEREKEIGWDGRWGPQCRVPGVACTAQSALPNVIHYGVGKWNGFALCCAVLFLGCVSKSVLFSWIHPCLAESSILLDFRSDLLESFIRLGRGCYRYPSLVYYSLRFHSRDRYSALEDAAVIGLCVVVSACSFELCLDRRERKRG